MAHDNDYLQELINNWETYSSYDPCAFLSVPEINVYLKNKISRIKQASPLFKYIRRNQYYVVVLDNECEGFDPKKIILVPGSYFLDFKVRIPSLVQLRQQLIDRGIPRGDVKAFSVELDTLVTRLLTRAEKSIERYQRYLETFSHPRDVSHDVLQVLFHEINSHCFYYKGKIKDDNEDYSDIYAYMVEELRKQLEFLMFAMKRNKNM